MRFELRAVEFMPKVLEPGFLYVSEKYRTAAHLCACGCGEKIRTPLGPAEWSVSNGSQGPSLWPSVGSWQRGCRSHYVIRNGGVRWASQWTEAQVRAGQQREHRGREAYFAANRRPGFWDWIKSLFGPRG